MNLRKQDVGMTDKMRPGFILLLNSRPRAGSLGCHRHRIINTPQIDCIAARCELRSVPRREPGLRAKSPSLMVP